MLAYFDTNVFDHLYKKANGVTDADEPRLRTAISSGRLIVVIGHLNILEMIAGLDAAPGTVIPELRLIASLVNWQYLVRFHSAILEDDIRHFAYNGERSSTPFEDDRTIAQIQFRLEQIIDGSLDIKELKAVISEDRDQKRAFLDGVKKARDEIAGSIEELRKRKEIPSFEEYFEDGAEEFASVFAQSYGVVDECKERGLASLLKIPSIRTMAGLGMSFIYRTAVDKKSPKSSASRDLQHAVCAAAATDVFVTHDEELSFLLRRVPVKRFQVMNLPELLAEIL